MHRQDVTDAALDHVAGGAFDVVENSADRLEVVPARVGQHDAPAVTVKQPDAEIGFERALLVADGTGRDVKLFRSTLDDRMVCGGFEGLKRFPWWKGSPVADT